jgi:hypothetical protein
MISLGRTLAHCPVLPGLRRVCLGSARPGISDPSGLRISRGGEFWKRFLQRYSAQARTNNAPRSGGVEEFGLLATILSQLTLPYFDCCRSSSNFSLIAFVNSLSGPLGYLTLNSSNSVCSSELRQSRNAPNSVIRCRSRPS